MPRCALPSPPLPRPSCAEATDELYSRSYPLPRHWPFGQIHLVMEKSSRSCDLYIDESFCCDMAANDVEAIEGHVREAIASVLVGCHRRPCRAIDLGANNGWMTASMLDLGAVVVSVEPQPDLASSVSETARVNCWSERLTVLNRFACPWELESGRASDSCLEPRRLGSKVSNLPYRSGGGPSRKAAAMLLGSSTPGIDLDDVIYHGVNRSAPLHVDLIKADGDGPELGWLRTLLQMLRADPAKRPRLTVDCICVEAQVGHNRSSLVRAFATVLEKYEREGYETFRLDTHDFRRLITTRGFDAFSPPDTIAPLGRVRGPLPRDALEEEILGLRAMRHVWRIKPNLTRDQWEDILTPLHPRFPVHELLLVHRRVGFVAPTFAWTGLGRASVEAQASGWNQNATAHRKRFTRTKRGPSRWAFDYVQV